MVETATLNNSAIRFCDSQKVSLLNTTETFTLPVVERYISTLISNARHAVLVWNLSI